MSTGITCLAWIHDTLQQHHWDAIPGRQLWVRGEQTLRCTIGLCKAAVWQCWAVNGAVMEYRLSHQGPGAAMSQETPQVR
jgi:hypothetical protein